MSNGLYYGYPMCCINEFIYRYLHHNENFSPLICENGFIPCETHARQILDKVVYTKDVIKNRECKWEFPKDDADAEYEEKSSVYP
jgi:hypothetical protein